MAIAVLRGSGAVVKPALAAALVASAAAGDGTMRIWGQLHRWVVTRWLRYGGGFIWPPRRQNAPMYLGVWGMVSAVLYFGFVRVGRSRESEWEQRRKRTFAEASIKNLLEYEQKRRQEQAAAEHNDKKAAPGDSGVAQARAGDDSGDSPEKKKAPDVEKMLSLLYDDVEADAITTLGVDQHEDWFLSAVGASCPYICPASLPFVVDTAP